MESTTTKTIENTLEEESKEQEELINKNAFSPKLSLRTRHTSVPHAFFATECKKYHLENSKVLSCSFCEELLWEMDGSSTVKDSFSFFKCVSCGFAVHNKCIALVPDSCKSASSISVWNHDTSEEKKFTHLTSPDDICQFWFSHNEKVAFGADELGNGRSLILSLQSAHRNCISNLLPFPLRFKRIKSVCSGASHTHFLTERGEVYSIGKNFMGQLGNQDIDEKSILETPVQISLEGVFITQIESGGNHSMALSDTGDIYTWGHGKNGRTGHDSEVDLFAPRKLSLSSIHKAIRFETTTKKVQEEDDEELGPLIATAEIKYSISCGWSHSIIIARKSHRSFIFTFGRGSYGQCGHGLAQDEMTPRLVRKLLPYKVIQISAGYYHTSCLVEDQNVTNSDGNEKKNILDTEKRKARKVFSFGFGEEGQCGQGDSQTHLEPVEVILDSLVDIICCCAFHTIALNKSTSRLYIWGKVGTTIHFLPATVTDFENKRITSIQSSIFQTAVIFATQKPRMSRDYSLIRRQAGLVTLEVSKKGDALSSSHYEILRMIHTAQLQAFYDEDNLRKNEAIEETLKRHNRIMQKKQEYNLRVLRRERCKEEVKKRWELYNQDLKILENFRRNIENKKAELEEAVLSLRNSKQDMMKLHQVLAAKRDKIDERLYLINCIRLSNMEKIRTIFPIEVGKAGEFTICELALPNVENFLHSRESPFLKDPFPKYDREAIAAALGFYCHLLCIMARYFNFPMTYKILPVGSRSLVVDRVNFNPPQAFPLFGYGVKQESFVSGLYLLSKDVEQLAIFLRQQRKDKNFEIHQLGYLIPNMLQILNVYSTQLNSVRVASDIIDVKGKTPTRDRAITTVGSRTTEDLRKGTM